MSSPDPSLPAAEAAAIPAAEARPTGSHAGLGARFEALVGRPLFWVALVALIALLSIGRAVRSSVPAPPALRIPLPAFELTNQRGERYGLEELRGHIWIADFIFTSCPSVCPRLTQRMSEIQHRGRHLGDMLRLVSFTVDPETDTPEVLQNYAKAHHADPSRWMFLTGPLGELEPTVVKGFKIAMGKEESSPGIFSIFHGERLVLVDQTGAIRGYYEADDQGLDRILRDAGVLANLP